MNFKETALGIEFGSTRIKAQLIDKNHMPIASGAHEWENRLINGIWTYTLEDIHTGLQDCYANLKKDVKEKFGVELTEVGAIGISAMMHGYFPMDKDGNVLTEFRTWRNTCTEEAAEKLSALFNFNLPQRWSIVHLYQAILNGEEHLPRLAHLTTLEGYIHWMLTGKHEMGIGEASGMFPLDYEKLDYDEEMVQKFDKLIEDKHFPWKLRDVLPKHLLAGEISGLLTEEGAKFLDPSGSLKAGIPIVPPEGDAETGMMATNAIRERTGNISAGTSCFAMIVLEHAIGVHKEIGVVATPAGKPVGMVHCSNCTSDINAWVNMFAEFAEMTGAKVDKGDLYTMLFKKALEGEPDCGGLLSYNYYSGEAILSLPEGRPVFARTPNSNFTLANLMRMHLQSALATLKNGLDIMRNEENVAIDRITGHGGFFKTPVVGQKLLSAAINSPVSTMETAGEGGPYGMALLGAYALWKEEGESLEDYLDNKVFKDAKSVSVMADPEDIEGFNKFNKLFFDSFEIEEKAVEVLKC